MIGNPNLSNARDLYIRESSKKMGRTKAQALRCIKGFDIANKTCASITSADIVALGNEKIASEVQPQAIPNYLSPRRCIRHRAPCLGPRS